MSKAAFFSTLVVLILLYSCQSEPIKDVPEEITPLIENQISEDVSLDPEFEKVHAQREKLAHTLKTEIDLTTMKKDIGFLSMGWSIEPTYLPAVPEGHKQYNYGAIGSLIRNQSIEINPSMKELRENSFKFISIITHKPWGTTEEKYYSTDNEIIIGLESKVNYGPLNELNLVGSDKNEITNSFGSADQEEKGCLVYKENQKILVIHFENDRADWLKFYHLNMAAFLNEEIPKNLLNWTVK